MTKIRMVVFDLGGVLVELTGVPKMMEWTGHALTEDELWRRWVHSPAGHEFESGRITPDEFARRLMAEFGMTVAVGEFLDEFATWAERLYPGAEDLVASLKGRVLLGCLSNTNGIHWERIGSRSPLLTLFDHRHPSHLTGLLKPGAAAFTCVAERAGVAPREIAYLDDSAANVDAALACGMQAFRVHGPSGAAAQLRALGIL